MFLSIFKKLRLSRKIVQNEILKFMSGKNTGTSACSANEKKKVLSLQRIGFLQMKF